MAESKCDPKKKNTSNETPLHLICNYENVSIEIIKYLVENLCDLNLICNQNLTSLHDLCRNENISLQIVKYLVENKSNLNQWNCKPIPLHFACRNSLQKSKFFS